MNLPKILSLFIVVLFLQINSEAQVKWEKYDGKIPTDAVVGGKDANGNDFIVCRCELENGTHSGKVINNQCNASLNGRNRIKDEFDVLIAKSGTQLNWVKLGDLMPRNAVYVGVEYGFRKIFVGRFKKDNGIHPAKVMNIGRWLAFTGIGNIEVLDFQDIEVLTVGNTPPVKMPPSSFTPKKGFYIFSPGKYKNFAISLEHRIAEHGRKIELKKAGGDYSQYFEIVPKEGGYYAIRSGSDKNLYLTPNSGDPEKASGFVLDNLTSDIQLFRIYKTRGGMHAIGSNVGDNMFLSIDPKQPGKLILRKGQAGFNTAFLIRKALVQKHEEGFDIGNTVWIKNIGQPNYRLNVEQNPVKASIINDGAWSAYWTFFPGDEKGTFYIKNYWKSKDYLQVKNGAVTTGKIYDNDKGALWKVEATKGGSFQIISMANPNLALAAKETEGLALKDSNANDESLRWSLPSVNKEVLNREAFSVKEIPLGKLVGLKNMGDKKARIHIEHGPLVADNAPDGWWSSHWIITKSRDNTYTIKNRWRNTFLQVQNGDLSAGGLTNEDNQKWEIKNVGSTGTYKIINSTKPEYYLILKNGKLTLSKENSKFSNWELQKV